MEAGSADKTSGVFAINQRAARPSSNRKKKFGGMLSVGTGLCDSLRNHAAQFHRGIAFAVRATVISAPGVAKEGQGSVMEDSLLERVTAAAEERQLSQFTHRLPAHMA
jgi:hypothetical protein